MVPERTRHSTLLIFQSYQNNNFKKYLQMTVPLGQTYLIFVGDLILEGGLLCFTNLFGILNSPKTEGAFAPALWEIGLCNFVTFRAFMLLSWKAFCGLIARLDCIDACLYTKKGLGSHNCGNVYFFQLVYLLSFLK
jgi:hypothetical protein